MTMKAEIELELLKEIDNVTRSFDFEKVHKVMTLLDWKWYFKDSEEKVLRIPKSSELFFSARNTLLRIGKLAFENEEEYFSSCGGFYASAYYCKEEKKWYLKLIFGIDESFS